MSDKPLKVTVYLRADGLPGAAEGQVIPGHAWASGVVRVRPSKAHRLRAGQPMPFFGMTQVGTAIEETLTAANVTLHLRPGRPARPGPARPVRRVTSQRRAGLCLLGPSGGSLGKTQPGRLSGQPGPDLTETRATMKHTLAAARAVAARRSTTGPHAPYMLIVYALAEKINSGPCPCQRRPARRN